MPWRYQKRRMVSLQWPVIYPCLIQGTVTNQWSHRASVFLETLKKEVIFIFCEAIGWLSIMPWYSAVFLFAYPEKEADWFGNAVVGTDRGIRGFLVESVGWLNFACWHVFLPFWSFSFLVWWSRFEAVMVLLGKFLLAVALGFVMVSLLWGRAFGMLLIPFAGWLVCFMLPTESGLLTTVEVLLLAAISMIF